MPISDWQHTWSGVKIDKNYWQETDVIISIWEGSRFGVPGGQRVNRRGTSRFRSPTSNIVILSIRDITVVTIPPATTTVFGYTFRSSFSFLPYFYIPYFSSNMINSNIFAFTKWLRDTPRLADFSFVKAAKPYHSLGNKKRRALQILTWEKLDRRVLRRRIALMHPIVHSSASIRTWYGSSSRHLRSALGNGAPSARFAPLELMHCITTDGVTRKPSVFS